MVKRTRRARNRSREILDFTTEKVSLKLWESSEFEVLTDIDLKQFVRDKRKQVIEISTKVWLKYF